MGKIATVSHDGSEITLSMVRWRLRRPLFRLGKKFGLINRFDVALFTPKYEVAVYEGGPRTVFSQKPFITFYYPNAGIALRKWAELASILTNEGLYGISEFIRAGDPHEQGVSDIDLEAQIASLFK